MAANLERVSWGMTGQRQTAGIDPASGKLAPEPGPTEREEPGRNPALGQGGQPTAPAAAAGGANPAAIRAAAPAAPRRTVLRPVNTDFSADFSAGFNGDLADVSDIADEPGFAALHLEPAWEQDPPPPPRRDPLAAFDTGPLNGLESVARPGFYGQPPDYGLSAYGPADPGAPDDPSAMRFADPYSDPGDPVADPYGDPLAAAGDPVSDPYGDPADPYADPYGDPYGDPDPASALPPGAPGAAPDPGYGDLGIGALGVARGLNAEAELPALAAGGQAGDPGAAFLELAAYGTSLPALFGQTSPSQLFGAAPLHGSLAGLTPAASETGAGDSGDSGDAGAALADESGGASGIAALPLIEAGFAWASPEQRARLLARARLIAAGAAPPANETRARELAQDLDLPLEVARVIPGELEEELLIRGVSRHPGLAALAAKSEADAALVRQGGAQLARAAANAIVISPYGNYLWTRPQDAPEAASKALADIAAETIAGMAKSVKAGYGDLVRGFWGTLKGAGELLGNEAWLTAYANRQIELAGLWGEGAQGRNGFEQFLFDFARQGPQMAGQVLFALPALKLGKAALALPVGFMAQYIFGSSYQELREKGIDPQNAALGAGLNAALQTPMEWFSMARFAQLFRATGVTRLFQGVAGAAATEFVTEWAQKWPEHFGHLWAESSLHGDDFQERWQWFTARSLSGAALWQACREGVYEGLIGAAWGGVLGAGGRALMRRRIQASQEAEAHAWHESVRELEAEAGRMARRRQADEFFARADEARARYRADPDAAHKIFNAILATSPGSMWIAPEDLAALLMASAARNIWIFWALTPGRRKMPSARACPWKLRWPGY